VHLRASTAQIIGLGLLVVTGTAVITVWHGLPFGGLVLVVGLVSLVREATGVELGPDGLRFWGFLRPREVSWAQVRDVDGIGSRIHLHTGVAVHSLGGPHRGLVLRDDTFDEKVATLRRHWQAHRAAA